MSDVERANLGKLTSAAYQALLALSRQVADATLTYVRQVMDMTY